MFETTTLYPARFLIPLSAMWIDKKLNHTRGCCICRLCHADHLEEMYLESGEGLVEMLMYFNGNSLSKTVPPPEQDLSSIPTTKNHSQPEPSVSDSPLGPERCLPFLFDNAPGKVEGPMHKFWLPRASINAYAT